MELLARGANFEMTVESGVVRLTISNPPNVDREEGARCAEQINETLRTRVLIERSTYRGLVFDVSEGPEVFGPKTRASLEQLFRAATTSRKRMSIRAGTSAIRRLQFASLCRECAPNHAKVIDDDREEREWLGGERVALRT